MIDRFSKSEFEAVLPTDKDTGDPLWMYYAFDKGEHTYLVPLEDKRIAVLIRSSIEMTGRAAPTGNDSIRLVLINSLTGQPLAKKIDAWTQRTYGWQDRMLEKIATLYRKGLSMVNCPQCDKGVLSQRDGKFGVFYGCSNYPRCKYTTNSLANLKIKAVKPETVINEPDDTLDFGAVFESLSDDDFDFDDDDGYNEEPVVDTPTLHLNAQQIAYVAAPINANIRVMASPGSGKTFASVERIVHLIKNGIDPNKIVYVTFTKAMATEGYNRILRRMPEVVSSNLDKQVCTIHALCFRILRWESLKRDVPKEWQVKQAINDIIAGDNRKNISGEWQHTIEKPGYKEVLWWIDNAKSNGITSENDLQFFVTYMPHDQAKKVHNARKRFTDWLGTKYITFADMPYLIEQRLQSDVAFRNKYQSQFSHIIVDECQDTNQQNLLILMTLSLEPGNNRIYEQLLTEYRV